MTNAPAFQLYAQDFLVGTADMTAEEVGGYMRLLCYQWVKDGIPNNDETLCKLSGCTPAAIVVIKRKFAATKNPSVLRNKKLERVRREQARFRQLQSKKAVSGWRKRKSLDGSALPNDMPKRCSSSSTSSSVPEHERESVGRPTWEEVRDYALSPHCGVAEWKARDWFNEMEGCGWLDYQHRPIEKWKAVLNRVKVKWEADGRPSGPTKAAGQTVPLWSQIKAIEALLADIERQLNAIPLVNGDLYPREAEQAKAKRGPLIERRKQLWVNLAALNARAAGGQA